MNRITCDSNDISQNHAYSYGTYWRKFLNELLQSFLCGRNLKSTVCRGRRIPSAGRTTENFARHLLRRDDRISHERFLAQFQYIPTGTTCLPPSTRYVRIASTGSRKEVRFRYKTIALSMILTRNHDSVISNSYNWGKFMKVAGLMLGLDTSLRCEFGSHPPAIACTAPVWSLRGWSTAIAATWGMKLVRLATVSSACNRFLQTAITLSNFSASFWNLECRWAILNRSEHAIFKNVFKQMAWRWRFRWRGIENATVQRPVKRSLQNLLCTLVSVLYMCVQNFTRIGYELQQQLHGGSFRNLITVKCVTVTPAVYPRLIPALARAQTTNGHNCRTLFARRRLLTSQLLQGSHQLPALVPSLSFPGLKLCVDLAL